MQLVRCDWNCYRCGNLPDESRPTLPEIFVPILAEDSPLDARLSWRMHVFGGVHGVTASAAHSFIIVSHWNHVKGARERERLEVSTADEGGWL